MFISIRLNVFKFILQMYQCINLLEVGAITMETTLFNKCLTTSIIVLDTNKHINMTSWLLVCCILKGTPKGVIHEHLKKDGHLDSFANIIVKAIFSF